MAASSRWTIPTRIVLGFVVVLAAFGMVAATSWVQHVRTANALRLLQEGYLPLALTLGNAKTAAGVQVALVERVVEQGQPRAARIWLNAVRHNRPVRLEQSRKELDYALRLAEEVKAKHALGPVRNSLDRVGAGYRKAERKYEELTKALDAEDSAAVTKIVRDLRGVEKSIQGHYLRAWRRLQEEIKTISTQVAEDEKRATILLGLLAALALIVGILVTWWSQRVLRPLPLLHERVAAVARGDLSHVLEVKRDDELGRLSAEFERMVAALAARDAKLRQASGAERKLQQMQRQIVEALSAAVIVVDAEGKIRTINRAAREIFGLSEQDIAQPIADHALFRRVAGLREAFESVARLGAARHLEAQQAEGFHERQVDVVVTPFGDEVGGAQGRALLIIAEDVTDAHATKAKLIQSERLAAIGRMAAHVTHEVRNPLSSIRLNVDMLNDEVVDTSEETHALVGSIQREVDRLTGITEEYLRLARLPEPDLVEVAPEDFVRTLIEFVGLEMEAAKVSVSCQMDSPLPQIAADEGQLRQALLNLIRNAREAMPGGGAVRVDVRRNQGGVSIQVHDEGEGISEDERERVFDLFYTTKERGTGLGLALTHQIITAHGGTIGCKSRLPKGTTFEVWLPELSKSASAATIRRVG